MSTAVEAFLEHHGIKGMKWGVRKSRSSVSTGSSKKRQKAIEKHQKEVAKQQRRMSEDLHRTHYGKPATKLSNEELNQRIKRIELEKKYNELKKPELTKGKKAANDILGKTGKQVAVTLLTSAVLIGVAAAIGRKNPGVAKALTGKDISMLKSGASAGTTVAKGAEAALRIKSGGSFT